MMSTYFKGRGGAGMIIDGCLRDYPNLKKLDLPLWLRGWTPNFHTQTGLMPFAVNVPIACGGVTVMPRDIIVADDDGAVVLPMALADAMPPAESDTSPKADVKQFLKGLRHAWKGGEVRPTSCRKPPVPRGRRRPDPLAEVTHDLRTWFDGDRAQTGRDLLSKLQATHPGTHPDGLLRTVQRRLNI